MNNNQEIKPSASCTETNTLDRYEVEYVDFLYRQHELKKHEEKLSRAKVDIEAAKAILRSNSDALWAAMYLLNVYENERGVACLGACLDPEAPVPRAIFNAFAGVGIGEKVQSPQELSQRDDLGFIWD